MLLADIFPGALRALLMSTLFDYHVTLSQSSSMLIDEEGCTNERID